MAAYLMTMTFSPSEIPHDLASRARALYYGGNRNLVQARGHDGSPLILHVSYSIGIVCVSKTGKELEVYHLSAGEGLRGPIPISPELHRDLTLLFEEARDSEIVP